MSMGKSMSSELNFSKGTTAKGTEGFELEEIVKIFANNLQQSIKQRFKTKLQFSKEQHDKVIRHGS